MPVSCHYKPARLLPTQPLPVMRWRVQPRSGVSSEFVCKPSSQADTLSQMLEEVMDAELTSTPSDAFASMRKYVEAYVADSDAQVELALEAKRLLREHGLDWSELFVKISRELEASGGAGAAFNLNAEACKNSQAPPTNSGTG